MGLSCQALKCNSTMSLEVKKNSFVSILRPLCVHMLRLLGLRRGSRDAPGSSRNAKEDPREAVEGSTGALKVTEKGVHVEFPPFSLSG